MRGMTKKLNMTRICDKINIFSNIYLMCHLCNWEVTNILCDKINIFLNIYLICHLCNWEVAKQNVHINM